MIAENQTFKGVRVQLDGGTFEHVIFEKCTLVYSGLMGASMSNCKFNDCQWELNGPAQETVMFLTALYAGGATELVENTLAAIRGERKSGSGPTLN